MPAGESVSPRAAPLDHPARLRRLPQREVPRVALERVGFHAHGFQQLRLVNVARQLAVIGELGDREIDVAVRFVCVSPFEQLADNLDHLRDVVGGFGEFVGGADSQLRLVRAESLGVELRDFGGRLALFERGGDHLVLAALQHLLAHVSHVGDVLDVDDVQPLRAQRAAYPVRHEIGAQVADVGVPVHRRPAGVHADDARLYGRNLVHAFG